MNVEPVLVLMPTDRRLCERFNLDIVIESCLKGAQSASGCVIIIDVFRAGNTAATLLSVGSPFVLPVGDLSEALSIGEKHPDWLLVGERGGLKPKGFHINNSPAEAAKLDLRHRPSVLTTSAGTRGLLAAFPRADTLLMATLVNAEIVSSYIQSLNPSRVTLVPIGLEARSTAVEDELVATYLKTLLQGGMPDYRNTALAMLGGSGADRLRRLGQWADLAFCLRLNRIELFPLAAKKDGRLILKAVQRIEKQFVDIDNDTES
jgi:2-phosphosulfolactate phosphatase